MALINTRFSQCGDGGDSPRNMTTSEFHAYTYRHGCDPGMPWSLMDDEICTHVRQQNEPEDECGSADEEVSTSAPEAGEALQAMHTITGFMEKLGSDLNRF